MKNIANKRIRKISVSRGDGLDVKTQLTILSELANMGYNITNPKLLAQCSSDIVLDYPTLIKNLKAMKGGDVDYVPLFRTFPTIPEDDEYFTKRIVGYIGRFIGLFDDTPEWLFDLNEFGADPVTQMQRQDLFDKGKIEQANRISDTNTEWTNLTLSFDVLEDLQKWVCDCLYAKSSIKQELHDDIFTVLATMDLDKIDASKLVMKENKTLLLKRLWDTKKYDDVQRLVSSPTDLLRLFASLTDSDISLAQKIKFPKLNRPQRRLVMKCLNKFDYEFLTEELNTYRGLWLRIGRGLHPGGYIQYQNVIYAFNALYRNVIESYNSKLEQHIKARHINKIVEHLDKKPGVFARKLHEIVRQSGNPNEIVAEFAKVAHKVPVKTLLGLQSYFDTINDADNRTIINKHGKIKVVENNSIGQLSNNTLRLIEECLVKTLGQQLNKQMPEGVEKIWIDPDLVDFTVPLQQRKMSDGLLSVGRGSKINFDNNKVLRLFVYWKDSPNERTDLDLSCISFDKDMRYSGHVSYTNLSSGGITHSGDIQSSPHGAAEFIDIDLKKVESNTRYVGIQIYRYTGDRFADLDKCHAGWSIRDKTSSDVKTFDIKTVINKVDIGGSGAYSIPIIADLKTGKIIYTDLYVNNNRQINNVEHNLDSVSSIAKEVVKFTDTRPNMYNLAMLNYVVGRPEISLVDRQEADFTVGIDGCDLNVYETERILAEML